MDEGGGRGNSETFRKGDESSGMAKLRLKYCNISHSYARIISSEYEEQPEDGLDTHRIPISGKEVGVEVVQIHGTRL